jgi:DNA polymerase-1
MEGKEFPFEVDSTIIAEADDLFGWYSNTYSDVVILTQDKDMRMVPGLHLDWVTNRQHQVVAGEDSLFNDKQYGIKWFWLQMLHGDTADNIPGLPKYVIDGKAKPVGEVTAGKILAHSAQEKHFSDSVAYCYQSYYGERWLVEMLEQACLLWMRRNPEAWDDCLAVGGPMHCFIQDAEFESAYAEIEQRVKEADAINNAAQAERD